MSDELEQMFATMRAREDDAMLNLSPDQKGMLGRGFQWFVSPRPEFQLVIFGEAWDEAEFVHREVAAGGDASEATRMHRDLTSRGYLYGVCYSEAEPAGEIGSTHVSYVVPISQQEFEEAKRTGFTRWTFSEETLKAARRSL